MTYTSDIRIFTFDEWLDAEFDVYQRLRNLVHSINASSNEIIKQQIEKIISPSYVLVFINTSRFTLYDIHRWIEENIRNKFHVHEGYSFMFENKNDAMLVKLRWQNIGIKH